MIKRNSKFGFITYPAALSCFFAHLTCPVWGTRVRQSGHVTNSCPTRLKFVSEKRIRWKIESDTTSGRIVSDSIGTRHLPCFERILFLSLAHIRNSSVTLYWSSLLAFCLGSGLTRCLGCWMNILHWWPQTYMNHTWRAGGQNGVVMGQKGG